MSLISFFSIDCLIDWFVNLSIELFMFSLCLVAASRFNSTWTDWSIVDGLSGCLFVCLLVCLFARLLVCLFVCLLVCLFVCLLVCLFICLFVCVRARAFVFVCEEYPITEAGDTSCRNLGAVFHLFVFGRGARRFTGSFGAFWAPGHRYGWKWPQEAHLHHFGRLFAEMGESGLRRLI